MKGALYWGIGIFFFSSPLYAYIDPGSGSAIMSAIVGFFVAIAMAVKTYWYKIKSFFSGSKPTEEAEEAAAGSDNSEGKSEA